MKKFLPFIILLLTIGSAATAQEKTFTLNLGDSKSTSYYEEIPYEIIGGKLVVTVIINDRPRKFIWDTGAPMMILGKLFNELKSQVIQTMPVYDAFGKKDSMRVVSLEKLTLGSTDFISTAALLMNENEGLECLGVDGLIGSNLLRNSIVQINSFSKKIIITNIKDKVTFNKKEGLDIFKTPSQSNPFIKIELPSRVSLQLLFDTGDDGFLSISNKNYDLISKEENKSLNVIAKGYGSNAYGIHGGEENTYKFRLLANEIKIGKTTFEQVSAETMNDSDSRLGAKLLEYGIVTLDYKNSKFYFQPFEDKKRIGMEEKNWQIEPTVNEGKIVAGMVWGKAGKQVRSGEQIVAIDGNPTDKTDLCELFRNKILPRDKDVVVLRIRDTEGREREIVNKKE